MKTKFLLSSLIAIIIFGFISIPVQADGLIVPDPCPGGDCITPLPMEQLSITYHHVTVKIDNQIATTHVDQVFYNPNSWTVEGTYIFPLPKDAVVSNFVLWMDGRPVHGQVLNADEARQTYEQIVRKMQDPALLEYIGQGAIQVRVYPILPGEQRKIELEYSQALAGSNGLVKYVYPLNTEKFSNGPLESVSINVSIHSSVPIQSVYSPTHATNVVINGKFDAAAMYEESNVKPDSDFALYYSLGEDMAFHLLSYRDPTDPFGTDGFFVAMLAPQPDVNAAAISKDVILVMDRSGSMDGEKFQQVQQAASFILEHLKTNDRFNLIAFNTQINAYAQSLQSTNRASDATQWINQFSALGSTDINSALLVASSMVEADRPTYILFLTDGLPTEGEVDNQRILDNLARNAPKNVRLFSFGVGYDVDTFLLDSLSQEHHGLSTYVTGDQSLETVLSAFYEKISTPVLTNLSLDFGGLTTYDIFPNPIPDLFAGNQIIIAGRYHGSGTFKLKLTGEVNGQKQTFTFSGQEFVKDNHKEAGTLNALPRLWATRKIGYLLNEIRLEGASQEIIDQIIKISVRFGIITPYTSYLVTVPSVLGIDAEKQVAQDTFNQWLALPTAPASGAGAVQKAADQGSLSQAQVAEGLSTDIQAEVKIVGSRTFLNQDGVWTDTNYDPNTMSPIEVPFLSQAYFSLMDSGQDVRDALALGKEMILIVEGKAYKIFSDGSSSGTSDITNPTLGSTVQTVEPIVSNPEPKTVASPLSTIPCLGGILPFVVVGLFLRKKVG
jgi:Ca-activated chloride channel homolog